MAIIEEAKKAEQFLCSHKLRTLISFTEEWKENIDTMWLAAFMENEIAYLIARANKFKNNFSSIEMDISRSSAFLWNIARYAKKMPTMPYEINPEKTIQDWREAHIEGKHKKNERELIVKISLDVTPCIEQLEALKTAIEATVKNTGLRQV